MKLRPAVFLVLAAAALALPASAQAAAKFGKYTVTFSGSQTLSWGMSGSATESCGLYSGTGRLDFKFGTTTARKVIVSNGRIGSFNTAAKGTQSGNYYVDTTSQCNPSPGPSYSGPITGCGAKSFKPELNFRATRSSTWIHSLISTQNIDDSNFDCAHFLQLTNYDFGVLDSCGPKEDDRANFYNNAVREIGGEGIFPTKFGFTTKSLLKIKKGKKKTFRGRAKFDCSPPTTNGQSVTLRGETKYSLTFKRTS